MKTLYRLALVCLMLAGCALCAACGGGQTADAAPQTASPTSAPAETPAPTASAEPVPTPETQPALPDGVYIVDVDTDSSMFHLNEASEGKGTLTVANGEMSVHISLPSKKIENLYYGMSADASKEGAELLQPTLDTVTYKDGESEEVYGFDIPVPYLDDTFNVAIIGTHGNWYDHKVSVSNPVPAE